MNEYDTTGKLIRSGTLPRNSKEVGGSREDLGEKPYHSHGQVTDVTRSDKSKTMFKFSVAIDFALAVVCAILLASRKTVTDMPATSAPQVVVTNTVEKIVQIPAQLSDEERAAIGSAAVEQFCSKLKDSFPKGKVIRDFDETVRELDFSEMLDMYRTEQKFKQRSVFFENLRFYVDFVNTKVLKGKTP